jgi:hypothetical protein
MFENNNVNDTFLNINIDKNITDKLLNHQILHLYDLITSLTDNNIAIDGSQTGSGKTYVAIAIAKHLNLKPLIICPKNVISMWKEICKLFDVEPLLIINYENIKKGLQTDILMIKSNKFIWSIQKTKHILIFDEAHRCKDIKSINAKLLLSTKGICKTLLLSATLTDKPENFYIYGNMLSLFNTMKQCRTLMLDIIKNGKNNMSNINPINLFLFPKYGSVMINEKLPKNIISAMCYDLDNENIKSINDAIHIIKDNLEITKIIIARQMIELIKIPIIIDLTTKYIDSGKSVVIFVNYIETLMKLSQSLNTLCLIHGKLTDEERENNINNFQNNKEKIIILTLQSGGQSISLHDKNGHHPRVSIILPSFSSIDLIQALGRIHRAGVKSYCYQNIIFCANTYEENICNKIKNKIKFMKDINEFNDNDFKLNDIHF